jgi:hypothetical protein
MFKSRPNFSDSARKSFSSIYIIFESIFGQRYIYSYLLKSEILKLDIRLYYHEWTLSIKKDFHPDMIINC